MLLATLLAVSAMHGARAEAIRTHQSVAEIIAEQQEIQADAKRGARGWDAIPEDKRNELMSRQNHLFEILGDNETIGDLAPPQQLEVANNLEWIKALADNAADERKVCVRERPVGSNRAVTTCRTARDMRRSREMSQEALRRRPQPLGLPGQR